MVLLMLSIFDMRHKSSRHQRRRCLPVSRVCYTGVLVYRYRRTADVQSSAGVFLAGVEQQ